MGEQKVSIPTDKLQKQRFVKALLNDVKAFEHMLDNNLFETGVTRIGVEQEMVLINNSNYRAAPIAMDIIEALKDKPWLETELAKFNLEIGLEPKVFTSDCFTQIENEISDKLELISTELSQREVSLLLTGILPTFRKQDLELHNLTPKKRYKALMEAFNRQLIGNAYELRIFGIDELLIKHNSPLLEACNTSFQVHLQTDPKEFVKLYNIAQTLAAPVLAIAANSPLVFGKRLWHEARIAMFQQSIDVRTTHEHFRERSPRVSFGHDWLNESILEIFKEDISRFRVLISSDIEEDSLAELSNDNIPKLRALQVHNSTVYRWNRPCYGISENGMPHLRIENRVLPAGPTIVDEVANASFWLGCMIGLADEVEDITKHISFIDIRDNFGKAAKFGIDSKFTWFDDSKITAVDLVNELLVHAKAGLKKMNVNDEDIEKYLGIIQGRTQNHTNGARWMLRSYTKLKEETTTDVALSALTDEMLKRQNAGNIPVHLWELPELKDFTYYNPDELTVSDIMMTDLFTVQKDDVIELVAEIMNWRNIKYTPVEDTKGKLAGLVSSKELMNFLNNRKETPEDSYCSVEDIMITDTITVEGEVTVVKAIEIMKEHNISCLPVVKGDELVGIVTTWDISNLSSELLTRSESNIKA